MFALLTLITIAMIERVIVLLIFYKIYRKFLIDILFVNIINKTFYYKARLTVAFFLY